MHSKRLSAIEKNLIFFPTQLPLSPLSAHDVAEYANSHKNLQKTLAYVTKGYHY
jgi:hypothetical protein